MKKVIITVVALMLLAGCEDKEPEMEYFIGSDGYVALMPKNYVTALKSLQRGINESQAMRVSGAYDPNDPALQFLAKPPAEWTAEHGDSERSLILYNLSATGVVAKEALRSMGVVSKCVVKAHPSFVSTQADGSQVMDPNNYVETENETTISIESANRLNTLETVLGITLDPNGVKE